MTVLRICIASGLLTVLSGTSVASQGVVSFQGAIVEFPCQVSTSGSGITLQGCPTLAGGSHSIEPVPSVRSIAGPRASVKMNPENALKRHYVLADSDGVAIEAGDYVMTLAYP